MYYYTVCTLLPTSYGSDLDGIYNAIAAARREKSKPTLIRLRTTIGYGSKEQGTHGVHGARAWLRYGIVPPGAI